MRDIQHFTRKIEIQKSKNIKTKKNTIQNTYHRELDQIAEQAEKDLNTHQAKTGAHKTSPSDEAGVDSRVEAKFPGAEVKYDMDLSTNRGYNRRIPPDEGGDLDARGRQTRGQHFEGTGGPEDKLREQAREYGGYYDVPLSRQIKPAKPRGADVTDTTVPYGHREGADVLPQGKEAVQANRESAA